MKLSQTEFAQLARTHETAEDHVKLAAHFNAHAEEHESDANLFKELAGHIAGHHGLAEAGLAGEQRYYAAHSRKAAEAMRNLAKIHESLAQRHRVRTHRRSRLAVRRPILDPGRQSERDAREELEGS